MTQQEALMTTKEAAKYLKVHERTVKRYIAEGIIPAIKLKRALRIRKADLDEFLKERTNRRVKP